MRTLTLLNLLLAIVCTFTMFHAAMQSNLLGTASSGFAAWANLITALCNWKYVRA